MPLCVPWCYDPCEKKTRFTHRDESLAESFGRGDLFIAPSWTPEYWTWQPQGLLNIGKQGVEKFKFN